MGKEKVFTTFKVWDKKSLSEKQVRDLATEHFEDIVETFGLSNGSYLECIDVRKLKGREKLYVYKIVQCYMPRGNNQ